MERKPWRCVDCNGVVAPHVDVHHCDTSSKGLRDQLGTPPLHFGSFTCANCGQNIPSNVTHHTCSGLALDQGKLFETLVDFANHPDTGVFSIHSIGSYPR